MEAKSLFSRALAADPDRLHFAAHSHHAWPDAVLEAHQRAATLAVERLDEKWGLVFGDLWPRTQAALAELVGLPDPRTLAFGPNTHEFLVRLVSSLPWDRRLAVLTTDAEFHAASRQFARWEECGRIAVERVPAEPFATFPERFEAAARAGGHDLVLLSHVHFDSGYVVPDLARLVGAVPDDRTLVLVDGYHAVNALPVDLAPIADRAFYTGGGYKYLMAGEGCCFLHCPPGRVPRPVNTGWFAGFGELTAFDGQVGYGEDGSRFLGATYDPTGLFRLEASLRVQREAGWTPERIHAHVGALQRRFLEGLPEAGELTRERVLPGLEAPDRGHFVTFRLPDPGAEHERLRARGVWTDHRRDRLRFGFAIYHDENDVDALLARIADR